MRDYKVKQILELILITAVLMYALLSVLGL